MENHPVFAKYRRDWLSQVTGYSRTYLCRVATGNVPLSRAFIQRVCYCLGESEEKLFLPDPPEVPPNS